MSYLTFLPMYSEIRGWKTLIFSIFVFFMILSESFLTGIFFYPNYDFILNSALVKRIKCRSGYNVRKKKVVEKWVWNYIWAELPHSFPSKINQDAPFKINQEKLSVSGDLVLLLWNLSGTAQKALYIVWTVFFPLRLLVAWSLLCNEFWNLFDYLMAAWIIADNINEVWCIGLTA